MSTRSCLSPSHAKATWLPSGEKDNTSLKATTTVLAIPKQAKEAAREAQLVFHRNGNEYFLAEIWTPGQNVGREVLEGRLETEVAKKGIPRQVALLTAH